MRFADTTRRRFLAAGIGGVTLLGAGGLLRWVSAGYALPVGDVALALTTKEMVVVRAIVDTLFPGDDEVPSGLALEVHQGIDEEVWAQPDETRADLKAALQLLEHAPPLFGTFGRFSSLPRETRAELYQAMLTRGPAVVVQASLALKQMGSLLYYAHPRMWPHLGYDGPWMPVAKPPPSRLRYQELLSAARGKANGRRA